MPLQEELEVQGNKLFKKRGNLPIIIILIGLGVFAYYQYTEGGIQDSSFEMGYKLISLAVCFLGLFIRAFTVGYTPSNTSGRNIYGQLADELNTSGIYSLVRHPLYVGNFFMWLGPAMLTQNLWFIIAFIFIFWVYYERIMFAEEQFLRKKFGEAYIKWGSSVPAFVPTFKNYRKPGLPFSWKKVLKQEKNGFWAIFVIFYIFDVLGTYINEGTFLFLNNYWFYAFIVTGVIYLILKTLKNKTSVLK